MAVKKKSAARKGAVPLSGSARARSRSGANSGQKKSTLVKAPHARRHANDIDSGESFCAAVKASLARGEVDTISDASLRRVLTAAVKLYAAKMDGVNDEIPPFEKNRVTATETVVASCAMIRAAGLNLFDVAMWFRRQSAGL